MSKPKSEHEIFDGGSYHTSPLSPRSPVRAVQQGTDIVESGRDYGFVGDQGAVILQGIGKSWKADQMKASGEEVEATFNSFRASFSRNHARFSYQHAPNKYVERSAWRHWLEAERSRTSYEGARLVYGQIQQARGKDVENIGLVNKKMQRLMLNTFQPLPNPDRKEAAEARILTMAKQKADVSLKTAELLKLQAKDSKNKAKGRPRKVGSRKRGRRQIKGSRWRVRKGI